jgi:putative transposase
MKKTRHTAEQIIRILREIEGSGQRVEDACRAHEISMPTYFRWKAKYGGMDLKEAQRLRDLERENTELKKLLADQMLKARALEIALEKNL